MKKWLDELENHIVKWLIGSFLAIICTGIIFYFDTKNTFAQNTIKIDTISRKVSKIDNQPEINTLKINQLKSQVKDIKEAVKEIKSDQKEIIKLLIDIKRKQ